MFRKPHKVAPRVKVHCGETMTEQAHKDECDINYILRDYQRTGFIRHAKNHEGRYDDVTAVDFQEAMNIVAQANSMFERLPGLWRKEFGNDPAKFLDFVQNPENKDKMEKMGILKGNDGIDINGAMTNAPVAEEVRTVMREQTEGTEAAPQ